MRARAVAEIAADDVPAHERAEVIFEADRVHIGAAVQRVKRKVRAARGATV
jgi:hypothetical protein